MERGRSFRSSVIDVRAAPAVRIRERARDSGTTERTSRLVGETCRIHYDDGRTIAAFRLEHIGLLERCARLGACLVMPPALLARALFHLASKRRRVGLALRSLPCMSLLVCCKTAGTCVGLLAGPGDSPQRIR